MKQASSLLVPLLAAAALGTAPAWGASSASSAVSDSVTTSLGSVSASFERSSDSSSGGKDVAAGDYRVIEVALLETRPQDLRLTLRAVEGTGATGEFYLYVPRTAAEQRGVQAGATLHATTRPYGVEFALGAPREAFFLMMDDAWYRELRTNPVTL